MIARTARKALSRLGVRKALLRFGAHWYPAHEPHVVQTTVRGVKLLVFANEDVGRRLVFLRQYEPDDADFLASLVRPADVCFDIGGNTGLYAMLMAKRATDGEVHAFEPVPLNRHLLASGALLNGFKHIVVNECAVGAEDGEMSFSEAVDGAYSSLVPVGRKSERSALLVKVRSLDSYVAEKEMPRVDVMKVDVEGAEPLVLQGAAGLFGASERRPRAIMLELLDINLSTYGTNVMEIVERMRGFSYHPYVAATGEGVRAFSASDCNRVTNIFFLTDDARKAIGK